MKSILAFSCGKESQHGCCLHHMQCIHSLPMRPCLAASRAACRAASSSDGYQGLRGGHRLLCRASAAKQTSKWEQDLAEVLREPQVRGHFSSQLRHLWFFPSCCCCRRVLHQRGLINPCKTGSSRSYKLLLPLGGEK